MRRNNLLNISHSTKETHQFIVPKRAVFSPTDVGVWEQSEGYQDLLGIITTLNESVKGKPLSFECEKSEEIKSLLNVLSTLSKWVDEIPPIDQPQRFGNKAYKEFYNRLKENCEDLLEDNLPSKYHRALPEVSIYLIESFGNSVRIDYGTGHELAFILFLVCLYKIDYLQQKDMILTVTKVFKSYLELARKLQMVYKMEPAGSQGVWSLDDYQFIPFIWGSSQLFMSSKIPPEMFTDEKTVEKYHQDFLFLSSIKFIMSVKTGPFAEHSNQLWNISGVQSWAKINQGLIKMYKNEILNKFPVIQHVLFGSIISIKPAHKIVYQPAGQNTLGGIRLPGPSPVLRPGVMPRGTDPVGCSMPAPSLASFPKNEIPTKFPAATNNSKD